MRLARIWMDKVIIRSLGTVFTYLISEGGGRVLAPTWVHIFLISSYVN